MASSRRAQPTRWSSPILTSCEKRAKPRIRKSVSASDSPIGYREQKAEVASIVTGAFGFRAIARELVGKIPFGGGLIPKAAVAFAGTYIVGLSLERYHRTGYGLPNNEQKVAYKSALDKGKSIVDGLKAALKKPTAV